MMIFNRLAIAFKALPIDPVPSANKQIARDCPFMAGSLLYVCNTCRGLLYCDVVSQFYFSM